MKSALRFSLVVLALSGCRAGDSPNPTTPTLALPGQPAFVVSDGATVGGNRDFFFLPPMVKNPSTNPNYQADAFNPNLKPEVRICALAATSATAVTATTLCKAGASSYTLVATATLSDGHYAYNWDVPKNGDPFYRVSVFVGATRLGFADITTEKSDLLIQVNDGRTLPVKFRIEQYALCAIPGTGPCASKTINLAAGGTVTTPIGDKPAGVIIPAQPNGVVTTVTAQSCPDLNPAVTDLPTYGPCVRVTASPALPPGALPNAATMFICAVGSFLPGTMTPEQTERVTMHRYDAPVNQGPARFAALPHAPACATTLGMGSVKGMLHDLARGAYATAGRELFAMLAPKPLNAATRRLDAGAGALTDEFSDFQFALPAKLSVVAGNGQTGAPASTLPVRPTVSVTDLAGDLVPNARVRFAASAVACAGLSAGSGTLSSAAGIVTDQPWVIAAGANTRVACGRGLAGTDYNGPRTGVDPFQPLSTKFADASNGLEVNVLTGSVQFSATGIVLPATLVAFGSGGYNSYGPSGQSSSYVPPAGWPNLAPATSAIVGSKAPFGGNYSACTITSGFTGTSFPENNAIFVTKTIMVPVTGTLTTTILIDNDMRVYVDGTDRTSLVGPTLYGAFDFGSGFWKHDNCADAGPAVLSIPITAGSHTIAVWARDRGAVGYLDVRVVLTP